MTQSPDDEEILDVFRQAEDPYEETLTTDELKESLGVERRTAQNYVNRLYEENRIVLDTEGKPNLWKLADTEPAEPDLDPQLIKAKRWGNIASKIALSLLIVAVGVLAAAGLITSNQLYAEAFQIYLPLLDPADTRLAVYTGVAATLTFFLSFLAYAVGVMLPRVVEYRLD